MTPSRRLSPIVLGLFVALAATEAWAPPPIPPALPAGLPPSAEGYDLRPLYAVWSYWIEAEKGPVTDALVGEPETVDGRVTSAPIMTFRKISDDFGQYAAGDLRAACRSDPKRPWRGVPGTCRYRMRWAFVPDSAFAGPDANPVARWRRENFEVDRLVRHLKAAGVAPAFDVWRSERASLFAGLPSPRGMLRENARVRVVDSADCPALARAVEALERRPLGLALDVDGAGQDGDPWIPPFHGGWVAYELSGRPADGGGDRITLEGGRTLERVLEPVLDAAAACDRRRPDYDPAERSFGPPSADPPPGR